MSEALIIEALQRQAILAAASENIPIAILGRTFDVPDDNNYLEQIFIPNNIDNEFWDTGKTYRGIYRLLLHWGLDDAGVYTPIRKLTALGDYFSKGSVFQNGDVSVKIYDEPDMTTVSLAAPEMLFMLQVRYYFFKTP